MKGLIFVGAVLLVATSWVRADVVIDADSEIVLAAEAPIVAMNVL